MTPRRRRSRADPEANEGYFASVSDLMVGVLFVFLLMLTVFALNFRDAERAQTVEREKYAQALQDLRQQQSLASTAETENDRLRGLLRQSIREIQQQAEDRAVARTRLLTTLQHSLHDHRIDVAIDPASGVLHLSGDVLFPTGSATIGAAAEQVVRALAGVLMQTLPCYTGTASRGCPAAAEPILEAVLVEGHTDRQRFQGLDVSESQARNDRLSTDRALAVFLDLRRGQPALESLRNAAGQPLLGVSGYGERRPRADAACGSDANCPDNRRIDVRFVLSARNAGTLQHDLDDITRALAAP